MILRIENGNPFLYQLIINGRQMAQPRMVVIRLLIECKVLGIKGKVGFSNNEITYTYERYEKKFSLPDLGGSMAGEFQKIERFVNETVDFIYEYESELFFEGNI